MSEDAYKEQENTPPSQSEATAHQQAAEETQALVACIEETTKGFLDGFVHFKEKPNWARILIFAIIRDALASLQHHIENSDEPNISWENPWAELQYPAEWDFENRDYAVPCPSPNVIKNTEILRKELNRALTRQTRLSIFSVLTKGAAYCKQGETVSYLLGMPLLAEMEKLPEEKRETALAEIYAPFSIGAIPVVQDGDLSEGPPFSSEDLNQLQKKLKDLPCLTFTGEVEGKPFAGSIVVQFHPLVVDEDERRAYYPVTVGLQFNPEKGIYEKGEDITFPDPSTWSEEARRGFWEGLLKEMEEGTKKLSTETAQQEALQIAEKAVKEETGTKTVQGEATLTARVTVTTETTVISAAPATLPISTETETLSPIPKPDRVIAPPAERRSVMSTVPIPRAVIKDAASLALYKGLGRMFTGYRKILDLDLRGKIATTEAEHLFRLLLKETLDKYMTAHDPPASWTQQEERGKIVYLLHGIQEREARNLWSTVTKTMNKGEGGPGLEVAEPAFQNRTRFEDRKVVPETGLMLWPDESLKDRDGWEIPPVRFRTEGSPGYLALLDRHGQKPYFADGWLWIPRGKEREGFRIGGLPSLLFPEGRAALERLKKREKADYETELNRIFREPSLFRDEDTRVVQDLRAAIRRLEAWLKELSTYDCQDMILCVFEAFHRQRDAWMAEKVILPNGRKVETKPWRIIRLDPEDLRIRLDPGRRWGTNWRARLFEKLEALTTFQRQTRTATGRKVDVGDRFLGRVVDGYRGVDEGAALETDPGLGLTRALKKEKAFPIDAFFVEVSVDFMERLVTWAVDKDGTVRWGIDAAKAAERTARVHSPRDEKKARQIGKAKREDAKARPYYAHSPRLLTVSNLEGWSVERKFLAHALLQEVTPNFERYRDAKGTNRKRRKPNRLGGKHALVTIDGQDYVACNGNNGHGYRLKTWIAKGEYERCSGPGGSGHAFAAFVEDLRGLVTALGLRLQFKTGWKDTVKVLETLEAFKRNPLEGYNMILQAFLPANLEEHLRERLAEVGIDAVDEEETIAPIFKPSMPGGLAPVEIRIARKRAGWKQAELAEKVGVSRVMIAYWETAKKPVPEERMTRLMEVLGPFLDPPNEPAV